jgi:hypothetical protein
MLDTKKDRELRALLAARQVISFLPDGEIVPDEEPDFRIITETGIVGVEVSELMPLPRSDSFSSPVAEQRLHESAIQLAERGYYAEQGAMPVKVSAFFWKIENGKNKKRELADALISFVKAHRDKASPVAATFTRRIPDGFSVITIASRPGPWWSGESMPNSPEGTRQQLAVMIESKNKLLRRYRANLPNSPMWLLVYSCAEVSRGVQMPHGISEWTFPFDFERVFFYATLDQTVEEIRKA